MKEVAKYFYCVKLFITHKALKKTPTQVETRLDLDKVGRKALRAL